MHPTRKGYWQFSGRGICGRSNWKVLSEGLESQVAGCVGPRKASETIWRTFWIESEGRIYKTFFFERFSDFVIENEKEHVFKIQNCESYFRTLDGWFHWTWTDAISVQFFSVSCWFGNIIFFICMALFISFHYFWSFGDIMSSYLVWELQHDCLWSRRGDCHLRTIVFTEEDIEVQGCCWLKNDFFRFHESGLI